MKDSIVSQRIYNGPCEILMVEGTITFDNSGDPIPQFSISVTSNSQQLIKAKVGFVNSKQARSIEFTNEIKQIEGNPTFRLSGENQNTRSIILDLAVLIDGKIPSQPIANSTISIVLPDNFRLINCNMEYSVSRENNQNVISINQKKKYLSSLVIIYSIDGIGLEIEKSIEPKNINANSQITVNLRLTNTSSVSLTNVLIEDNFDSRDFSPVGEGFTQFLGKENDRRLIWTKVISRISPGQTIEITFAIKSNFSVEKTKLSAAIATINGRLIGVSNEIIL